ncbi:phosphinothricin acetyltransferase [Anaerolineae bacterium]|nr:phosphinothricin acetyltransferase [Anaerolineae bacterium]
MARIAPLNHRDAAVAKHIHAVHALAYAQEALLLNVKAFPPLDRTVEDIQSSTECYLGVLQDETLVGVVGFEPDEEPGQVLITSRVVHPKHQRRGYARALMVELFRMGAKDVFAVCTATANAPALDLYRSLGFSEYRFGTIGPEALPLVKLRRACPNPSIEGTASGRLRPPTAAPHVKR